MIQTSYYDALTSLPRAYSNTIISGDLKTKFSDFIVKEVLPFQPSGEGEHLFLQIEKIDCNTDWVKKQLQAKSLLSSKDIGYAGKKDRYSLSTQWFSLHLPGKTISLEELAGEGYQIIQSIRHNKKLRVGSLKENIFEIKVRNLTGNIDQGCLETIKQRGFPNYYGLQRFGHDANNLELADKLLMGEIKIKNRNKRSMVISSSRSYIFNQILAKRIRDNSWLTPAIGDYMMLDKTQSYYQLFEVNETELERFNMRDTHISGLLAGKVSKSSNSVIKSEEKEIPSEFQSWNQGLKQLNIDASRRAFRCIPHDFKVQQEGATATFYFRLDKGCFATSLLREFLEIQDKGTHQKKSIV